MASFAFLAARARSRLILALSAMAWAVLSLHAPATAQDATGSWRLLAHRQINTTSPALTLDLRQAKGAYKALRIENKGEAVDIAEIRITWSAVGSAGAGSGTNVHTQSRAFRLGPNERTRPIDPGANRFLERLEIVFKRAVVTPGQSAGRAEIEIWGLQDAAGSAAKRGASPPPPVAAAPAPAPSVSAPSPATRSAPIARSAPPAASAPAPTTGAESAKPMPPVGSEATRGVRIGSPRPQIVPPARESAAGETSDPQDKSTTLEPLGPPMRGRGAAPITPPQPPVVAAPAPPPAAVLPSPPPAAAAPSPGVAPPTLPPPIVALPAPTVAQPSVPARDPAVADKPADWDLVPVWFGTDRAEAQNPKRIDFGLTRGRRLALGQAVVSVPKVHQMPNVERPWVLQIAGLKVFEEKEDPKRHFTIQEIRTQTEAEMIATVQARLAQSKDFKDHALIFVHGFNNTFDGALYRTAQIAYDLRFDGAPFMYSWPSRGTLGLTDYQYDRESATQAEPYFRDFVNLVVARSGAKTVSVVAHSMGNWLLLNTLRSLKQSLPDGVTLSQVILAAPDVDRDTFANIIKEVRGVSLGMTLLAAGNDRALQASKNLARESRAGDVPPEGPIVLPGLDTIDVTAASTDIMSLNHTGFAEKTELMEDMRRLLLTGVRPPEKRFPILERVTTPLGDYWRLPPPKTVAPASAAPRALPTLPTPAAPIERR